MNVYYEFHDDHIGREVSNFGFSIPSKYCVRLNISDELVGAFVPGRLVHAASRMWQETNQGVVYLKKPGVWDSRDVVDLDEFLFVKLKSVTLDV